VDNIIIAVLGTLTLSFAIAYLSVLHRLSKLTQDFAKLFISHESLQNFVKKTKFESKSDEDIHKENFIKFLSDSRDWAFGYIEDVQKGLEKFISYADPEINYFDENSDTSKGTDYHKFMKNFSKEYEELKKLMPTDTIKKDA
jgi:hypothetical protein